MKLSIIIPTFNSSKVIGRALDSIVVQTFDDWEVLVMDGVSKDNTGKIVQSYNDERIKFYSEPDKGIYDAMNKGIKKSKGEWLYFLGSDDWLYDSNVLSFFFSDNDFSKYDVVYGDVSSKHLDEKCKGKWSSDNLRYNRCHQAIFYKKILFRMYGGYNLKYKLWADHDINLKWFLDNKVRSIYVSKIVSYYSDGGVSSNSVDEKFIDDFYCLVCVRGYKSLDAKDYRKYLDMWAYKRKKQNRKISAFFVVSFIRLYMLFHKRSFI